MGSGAGRPRPVGTLVGAVIDAAIHHWRLASDATRLAEMGGFLLALAMVTLLADRRAARLRRQGASTWVPWTGMFLALAVAGFTLLAVGLPPLLQGR